MIPGTPDWQDEDTLLGLLPLLADPVDRKELTAVHEKDGEMRLLRGRHREYPVVGGIPDLRAPADELRRLLGLRSYDAWSELQQEAEASYATRVEGHFSTESWGPASNLAEALRLADDGRWLDAGCGLLPRPAYQRDIGDKAVVGVDPMAISARRDFPFVRALADRLPFRRSVFDGVVLPSSLDHAIEPRAVLAEVRRCLRHEGTLVVLETMRPDDERYRRWRASASGAPTRYNSWHHWAFVEKDLRALLASAGFRVTSFERAASDEREAIVVARRSRGAARRLVRAWRRSKASVGQPL